MTQYLQINYPQKQVMEGSDLNASNTVTNKLQAPYQTNNTNTSGGSIVLNNTSLIDQWFTGSTATVVSMPVGSSIYAGVSYTFINNSSATLTIKDSTNVTIITTLSAAQSCLLALDTIGSPDVWTYNITGTGGATTNSLTSSVNSMTSDVNGTSSSANIINSISNTSSANTIKTTVNGVAGSTVNIINSNALSSSANTLTSTINGVANTGTGTIINSNALNSSTNIMSSTINGVSSLGVNIVNSFALSSSVNTISGTINGVANTGSGTIINSNTSSYDGNNLTNTINGVASTALEIDGGTLKGYDPTNGITSNTVLLNTSLTNLYNYAANIANGITWQVFQAEATGNINISNPGTNSFDGVILTSGNFLFLNSQTDTTQNGGYVFNGSASALTRVPSMSTWTEIRQTNITIEFGGSLYGNFRYYPTVAAGGTIGTTAITYSVWNTTYTAGTNISISGSNAISVVASPSFTGLSLTNALTIGNGGTGQQTQAAAITALTGSQTSGYYLRSNGTNAALAAIQAADLPNYQADTTWTPADGSGASLTFSAVTATYSRNANLIFYTVVLIFPTTASSASATISGLPVAATGTWLGSCLNTNNILAITKVSGSSITFFSAKNEAILNSDLSGSTITVSGYYSI
jgi:hypothetical protein